MAAHSGGSVEWSSIIKPISMASYGPITKSDVLNIIKAILKSENDILEHDESYEQFYMSFAALSADSISAQCSTICQNQMAQFTEATSILIRYILNRIEKCTNNEIKLLLPAIKSLCEGKCHILDMDLVVLASVLRNSKHPEHLKTNMTGNEKDSPKCEMKRSRSDLSAVIYQQLTTPFTETMAAAWAPLNEEFTDCSQLFMNANIAVMQANNAGDILLNVCSALPTLSKYYSRYEESAVHGKSLYLPLTYNDAIQIKSLLPQMSSDITILSLALSLPLLHPLTPSKICQLSQCAMSALYCAVMASISGSVLNMSSASSQKSSGGTITTTTTTTSTSAVGTQTAPSSTVGSGGGGIPQPISQQKDNEEIIEDHARVIVDKALEIYTTIGNIFKNSARIHIYQNHLCMGSWLLISGIQGAMGASGSSSNLKQSTTATTSNVTNIIDDINKGKSPSRTLEQQQQQQNSLSAAAASISGRVNLFKVQQGFCVLNAAIARHSIQLLTDLIENLKIESRSGDTEVNGDKIPEPAGFDILGQYTSLQRIVRVLHSTTLQQLLTFLATISYRKACNLKRINIKNDGDQLHYSDSTTYFNETFSCSDGSETEEEDSDCFLGVWFKETLSPETNDEPIEQITSDKNCDTERASALVSAKDEPHEYLELSVQIFTFLDKSLGGNHLFLNKYVRNGLSEQQMVLLANILKDLDRDSVRSEFEQSNNGGGTQWQTVMMHFTSSIGRYIHNLIAGALMNETLQSALLLNLGVSPYTQDTIWPMQVYSRTLSVLVQILLLKPPQEKEAACLSVWHRLVNTLVEGVCNPQYHHLNAQQQSQPQQQPPPPTPTQSQLPPPTASSSSIDDFDDLNFEHAQLLLFLFHSLNLMQKKSILLLTAGGVIRCAEVFRTVTPEKPLRDIQITLLSRLLLFLEYLMKHLYNAPTILLEQVRWNLFGVMSIESNKKISDIINNKTKMMSFYRKDIEDKYRKHTIEPTMRPKFYSLTLIDSKIQQEFKLDGLAWNFILCTPDKLKYPLLIDALIDILSVVDISMAKIQYQQLCSVHYCFNICWKLLLGLPPSTPHVESLLLDKTPNLHSLIWTIRCFHAVASSHYLIVNSLVKQGMYTKAAEQLWSNVTEHVSNTKVSLKLTTLGLDSFYKTFQIDNPRLSKILLIDAIVSHLYAIYRSEKDTVKVSKVNNVSTSSSANISSASDTSVDNLSATSINELTNTTSTVVSASTSVSTTTDINTTTTDDDDNKINKIDSNQLIPTPDLSKDVMIKLLNVFETIKECAFKIMSTNLSDSSASPNHIIESLISMSNLKNQFCNEIVKQLPTLISVQNKDIISLEWRRKNLIINDENFSNVAFPVELHTINVIDAHLLEIYKHPQYSILLSLKHSMKSILNLIYYLLPDCKDDDKIVERLKTILVPMLFDIRTEYLYDITNKCLETLLDGDSNSDQYQFLSYSILLQHSYNLLIDYTELSTIQQQQQPSTTTVNLNMDESILHYILKFWEQLLKKSMGLKAMHDFFYKTKKGQLVDILLSFSNTTLSQLYSTKVLQFFENLFQASDKPDSPFHLDELCACVSELGNVESYKLRDWLSHILLGPNNGAIGIESEDVAGGLSCTDGTIGGVVGAACGSNTNAISSGESSNVQTPTNMATVSAIPSITDPIANQSELGLDPNAMEIDDEWSIGMSGAAAAAAVVVAAAAAGSSSAVPINTSAAIRVLPSAPIPIPSTSGVGGTTSVTTAANGSCGLSSTSGWQSSGGAVGTSGGGVGGIAGTTLNIKNRSGSNSPTDECLEKNSHLLQSLTKYIVSENRISSTVSSALFNALLQIGSNLLCPPPHLQDALEFSDILQVMITLADASLGKGHYALFSAAIEWLIISKNHIVEKNASFDRYQSIPFENIISLLRYMVDLLQGLGYPGSRGLIASWEDDIPPDIDECSDELGAEDDDSAIEDSDEDSLGNKLCTYAVTQREFMNQHWYHCHTCKMVDGVGVCSVCARVCHKNHDISYAKFGNFFCDCGAKEDNTCQALSRRTTSSNPSNITTVAAATAAATALVVPTTSGPTSSVSSSLTTISVPSSITLASTSSESLSLAAAASISTTLAASLTSSAAVAAAAASCSNALINHINVATSSVSTTTTAITTTTTTSTAITTQTPTTTITTTTTTTTTAAATATTNQNLSNVNSRPTIGSSPQLQQSSNLHQRELLKIKERSVYIAKMIEDSKDKLHNTDHWKNVINCLFDFIEYLMPAIRDNSEKYSTIGCHIRAKMALGRLHNPEKTFTISDQIMVATLGSQEGAFENVRMSYAGEQGQTIRQLLTNNLVRRVALCCLASPHGKRQHLAVCHERGKVTILQLSALLKQADAAKRKLTLTRLASAPIPCTVLSLASNPANEDFLAVCGLKECHILTFSSSGATNAHIVLTPPFDTGNFIKRAIWLPGSQTMLALITADFIKIYELAEDTLSPQYYFLVPSGKIRECTFIYQSGTYYMLLFASSGYIYTQPLTNESLAKHGAFYVTNTLELDHPLIQDVNGQIGGGGVSIYYSHVLQILFFSYTQGKTFMAPLVDVNKGVECVIQLQTAPNTKSSSKVVTQPLCQWTEIAGHPGLICAMMQTSNNPVIFMLKPDAIIMQEIKAQSSKAKIMDMVAIRHSVSGVEKTTLILLCEDGSLRIYSAHAENTNYWLSSKVQPIGNQMYMSHVSKSTKHNKKHSSKTHSTNGNTATTKSTNNTTNTVAVTSTTTATTATAQPTFPVDFFEHCTCTTEIEFGGNDILQIYNLQQLKNRLNSTGLYIASSRANGFTMDITNNDSTTVLTGVRVQIGSQELFRSPQTITINGNRTINTIVLTARWIDIPLTRDESIASDKKLSITFGPSQDPESICIVDSIKAYVVNKDTFGWPDETDEVPTTNITSGTQTSPTNNLNAMQSMSVDSTLQITPLDRMLTSMLEVLDCGLSLLSGSATNNSTDTNSEIQQIRKRAVDVASHILIIPTPNSVQLQTKCVLAALHDNRTAYNVHKDTLLLIDSNWKLMQMTQMRDYKNIDPELFYRVVLLIRAIAVARPFSVAKLSLIYNFPIIEKLLPLALKLYNITPSYEIPSSIVRIGLSHPEGTVHCLVEIIYAFAFSDPLLIDSMTKFLIQLLLDKSMVISHSAKYAMITLLRPKVKRKKIVNGSGGGVGTPPSSVTPSTLSTVVATQPPQQPQETQQPPQQTQHPQQPQPQSAAEPIASTSNAEMTGAVGGVEVSNVGSIVSGSQVVQFDDNLDAGAGPSNPSNHISNALLAMENFHELLAINQNADDAIIEIAIALSLQDNEQNFPNLQQEISNIQEIRGQAINNLNENLNVFQNNYNDAVVSAGGSDDEGSNVATDGSTLRTSPAEPAGSGGSESGGSCVESIGGTSGRSSTYGDQLNTTPPRISNIEIQQTQTTLPIVSNVTDHVLQEEPEEIVDVENVNNLHVFRVAILQKLIDNMPSLDSVNGHQAIPYLQVILMLTIDLDCSQEGDQIVVQNLVKALVERLDMPLSSQMVKRTPRTEVQLVILRLVGVFMGKVKSSKSSSSHTSTSAGALTSATPVPTDRPHSHFKDTAAFIAQATANALTQGGALLYCATILKTLLPNWESATYNDDGTVNNNSLLSAPSPPSSGGGSAGGAATPANNILKATKYGPELDMQPIFIQNTKGINDVFELYLQVLTEMTVRLPYQIFKLSSEHPSTRQDDDYVKINEHMAKALCQYMMILQSATLRRQVRKLLMYMCGSKEKYREKRDFRALNAHFDHIRVFIKKTTNDQTLHGNNIHTNPALSYDALVELTEHLRACQEVASARPGTWQRFCFLYTYMISSLIRISCYQLDEVVSPIILQLLQAAVCNANSTTGSSSTMKNDVTVVPAKAMNVTVKARHDREKSEEGECSNDSKFNQNYCSLLVRQIFTEIQPQMLTKFIKLYLLETNITAIRWQAHSLLYALYENSNGQQKEQLLNSMWGLWSLLPQYGRRTAQFVDLLGYLTLNMKFLNDKLPEYMSLAISVLRQQNEFLSKHPNGPLYTSLGYVLELDGFYLESEPCLVCNNPEIPMSNIKLSSIKIDSKFTTTTTIVKLVQSHTISKITLRIADLKRTKMVRTINIYYNNRTVQAVVELKNRPSMWHKARKVTLQSGQIDVKIEFPLPITACNLMIEYSDFYETVTGSSESLQCPRCSAAVPSNPGVCSNCGENVFQCHKCRAINYDEKDPFLCHSCGYCKYAKFDYTIYGRVCCAVDPIESADDRAKTCQTIHSSLEKADRVYRALQANKQILELLVQKVSEHKLDRTMDETIIGNVVGTSQVNKVIQLLAQKYCVESKTSFEELSKIIQKVQACRRELVAYDRSQIDLPITAITASSSSSASSLLSGVSSSSVPLVSSVSGISSESIGDVKENKIIVHNRCYGCALASTEQCLTLLRAMASNMQCRVDLCKQGLVEELSLNNLRRGSTQIQDEVRQLLCLLTNDLPDVTQKLCNLIEERVKLALSGIIPLANIDVAIRHEMSLLESLLGQYDSGWEIKLKTVLKLFIMAARDVRGPPPSVIQPTLRILESLLCPLPPKSKINKDLSIEQLCTIKTADGLTVNCERWIENDKIHSFEEWKSRMQPIPKRDNDNKTSVSDDKTTTTTSSTTAVSIQPPPPPATTASNTVKPDVTKPKERIFGLVLEKKRLQCRHAYLMEKYARKWRNNVLSKDVQHQPLQLEPVWLQKVLFNQNSRLARQLICSLVPLLINKNHERHREILNVLNGFLKYVGESGEACDEFLLLYRTLAENTPWRQYLVLQGTLSLLADLLNIEIEKIHCLEETTLSSDLAQGYALRHLVELMSMFLDKAKIRQVYKGKLLGPVLQGYLSLRKLVVQRTRLVDDAQEKLLEMLEEMTTGTEDETRAFMVVLIETVQRTSLNDIKTPVFIFERLCSIIHPEENDVGEFFLTLEKDPQQEDFLQGRMLGNPYPSTEAGLGPLMRDVKNKICMDCELVALLEDDNGMELLVYNKIISLDLPVKDVYKKVWLAEGGERDTMRIVYRMRGLLGDATEEFIETLNNKSTEEIDNEKLYCMANVLAECGGLKVMLDRIVSLQNVSRSRSLLQVLLKLFLMAVKVRRCQDVLCLPELGAINTLLKVLQLCLQSDNDSQQSAVTEQLLEIMETILSKAASDTLDSFLQFSLTFGGPEYVTALISCTNCVNVRNNPSVLRHLIRVLAALVYGNDIKMGLLCEHFKDTLDFSKFDVDHTHEDDFKMELFCVLTNQIEHNSIGGTLKDYIISLGIVEKALNYIVTNAPCVKPTLLRTDSDELKEFLTKPSLKYILRFLTGLTTKHEPTQISIAKDIIPIIHRLEQVSSDEHVGSLAENLLEALCTDPMTAERVQEVRDFTRAEKKRLAMATRVKQLDALGMRTNEKGQVTAKGSILQKMEKLRDETGLTCFICREGYACQPTKVLGIYTFTKRTNIEEYELKPRKTLGYTTVTYFNVVHIDCHMSAIRLARGRDEWESASLQNANTRCNGLLPLFGPDISENAFSSCMSRHNVYMQESTQRCEITFNSGIHDLKLLLLRFAQEKSFHDDAGGGGPQSNMHLVPYLLFYSLYMLLSTRSFSREERLVANFVRQTPAENWLGCAYEVEGPLYQIILSIALHTPEIWKRNRLQHLKRLIVCGHVRYASPSQLCKALSPRDCVIKNYASYKPYIMFWALVDLIYRYLFKTVTTPKEEDWPISLFDYIRRNDESMLKATDLILQTFTEEYIPCTSFAEFCDVAELLNDIEDPDKFLTELLLSLPSLTA